MISQSSLTDALERTAPPMGGFSLTVLRLEVRRLLRNRRTMVLAIAMPVIFFFAFGRDNAYVHQTVGRGNLTAFEMISIALFGAVFATATGGAMVSIERTLGWSRQLRVTPLTSPAYIAIKMLTSLTLAAGAVGALYLVGAATNQAAMPMDLWVITGICVWIGSLLFSALGLFIGYLLPSENVTQIISLILMRMQLCGRPLHSGQPLPAQLRHHGAVHAAVRAQSTGALPVGWWPFRVALGAQPGRMVGSTCPGCCLAVSPGHGQSMTVAIAPTSCTEMARHAKAPRAVRSLADLQKLRPSRVPC